MSFRRGTASAVPKEWLRKKGGFSRWGRDMKADPGAALSITHNVGVFRGFATFLRSPVRWTNSYGGGKLLSRRRRKCRRHDGRIAQDGGARRARGWRADAEILGRVAQGTESRRDD